MIFVTKLKVIMLCLIDKIFIVLQSLGTVQLY